RSGKPKSRRDAWLSRAPHYHFFANRQRRDRRALAPEPGRRLPVLCSAHWRRSRPQSNRNLERRLISLPRWIRSRRSLQHPADRHGLYVQARRAELDFGEDHAQLERRRSEQYGRLARIQTTILRITSPRYAPPDARRNSSTKEQCRQ